MKVSLNWLSDFVDLADVDVAQLTADLTEKVAEVEGVERHAADQAEIVVGVIQATEKHPDADKLTVCQVNVGTALRQAQDDTVQIVCGGANVRPELKVAVALPGAMVRWHGEGEPVKLGKARLRGQESYGMICSAAELEVAPEALGTEPAEKGIVELVTDAPAGTRLSVAYPSLADTILDVDNHAITHRPDLFSHVGFAREVAVMQRTELHTPVFSGVNIDGGLAVDVQDTQLCPRYIGLNIGNVVVRPSPQHVADRLTACGMRPINNIVDASNYVMLELGQPTHAFDATKIADRKIVVRRATEGETLESLDGETRRLTPDMLVIADEEKPVALAGVMGGANSEVDENTTEIILEAANFDAANVRRTATALGLRTEAGLRFEKRLSPAFPPVAIARFVQILRETCPDLTLGAGADVAHFDASERSIALPVSRVSQKLGVEIAQDDIVDILTRLEFAVEDNGEELHVTVPAFRAGRDVEMADDLIEEIARHHGFNQVVPAFPVTPMRAPERSAARRVTAELQDAFVGFGFAECCTLGLVSADTLARAGYSADQAARLVNPPSEDYKYLRTRLLPSLLLAAERNAKHRDMFRLFEVGTVFDKKDDGVDEWQMAVGLVVEADPFAQARGIAQQLLRGLRFSPSFVPGVADEPTIHPGRVAEIRVGEQSVGAVAELHPAVAERFDIPAAACIYLSVDVLKDLARPVVVPTELPKYPGVPRDIAVLVDDKTLVADITTAIQSADPRVADVELFDTYLGEGVPEGQKSLAFRFEIRDTKKTLADPEAEAVMSAVMEKLQAAGATMRS